METALNLGHDPTPTALDILGEHHIAILKSAHRAEWRQYQESLAGKTHNSERGGIMSGSVSSSSSIFSPKDSGEGKEHDNTEDKLSMLKQGAASYDGNSVPSGDEIMIDDTTTLRNSKNPASVKANY